jgi:oligoendopeptidase, M3 family
MRFDELKATKPNEAKLIASIKELTAELKAAKDAETAIKVVQKSFKQSDKIETNFTVISIRHSIDMNDKKISKLSDICDEVGPKLSPALDEFNHAIMDSKFKDELVKKFGQTMFDRIENEFKIFKPEIVEDKIKENQLVNKYQQVIAGAKIEFRGNTYNLSSIGKFMSDKDRDTRLEAAKAYYGYLEAHDAELGQIYSDLVSVRTKIAKTLGFKNAIEYEYRVMGRLDYGPEEVAQYRKQIYESVVPVVSKLRKRQASRIGIKHPLFVDYNLEFTSGNAKPCGDSAYLVKCASKMYHEMSPLTGDFFDKMANDKLLDLDAKPGKMTGGYMTYIPKLKMPFIFSNSNGTSSDVDTLTHEFGHSFQGYLGSKIKVPSYRMPTMEACEIDSMSMEFFAWPWMNLFFADQADKYRFAHLSSALSFLPYGCEVDEFQHWVYENPTVTHEERCKKWAEIDHKYRPDFDYTGFEYAQGHLWMRQAHIYQSPFYYIDYCLAQVLALEFKCEMDKNRDRAWKKYVKLLKMGGKYPFLTLINKAHLRNPFVDGNVKKVVRPQVKVLNSFDDSKM